MANRDEVLDAFRIAPRIAIVIPEAIDAIRALTGRVTDGRESIAMTDKALGVQRDFVKR